MQCVTWLLLGNHPSYDVTPYDITPYDVTPYDVTPYDVTPYDVIMWACDLLGQLECGFPHENSCQTPIKREWNAEVRTLRFALTQKSCNLIGQFVPRDLYTRRWLATGRSDSGYYCCSWMSCTLSYKCELWQINQIFLLDKGRAPVLQSCEHFLQSLSYSALLGP